MAVDQAIIDKLVSQILSSSDPSKWTGAGYGSAEANARDMAKILANTGITDISQFGQVPVTQKVEVIQQKYNGQNVSTYQNEDGTTRQVYWKPTGKTDEEGNPLSEQVLLPKDAKIETVYGVPDQSGESYNEVDTSKVKAVNGQLVVDTAQTTFGNKLTGQEVPNTYSERQTGNAFGGTFAGSGNTGYRVEFDPSGKPIFYTTGASSSDVPSWVKPALILGGAYLGLNAAGLLGGAGTGAAVGAGAGAGSLTAGMTVADIAAAEALLPTISGAGAAAGGAGLLSSGGSLTAGFTPAQIAAAEAALPSFGSSLTAGITAADIAAAEAGLPSAASLTSGMTAAQIAASEAGLPGLTATEAAALYGGAGSLTAGLTPAQIAAAEAGLPAATTVAGTTAGTKLLTDAATKAGVTGIVNSVLAGGGLTTAGGLLQQQTSKEAATAAQKTIDTETAAAKLAAAFKPVGMTTRFGSSQFKFDPTTGQLTSAGYTLSPEAKAAQDRFVKLSEAGLTQAEAAQKAFAPLETGAQSLFTLGNQYLAKSPEAVAQNYLNQQMALLQPGRELELATLQNKLVQQGRSGLSVAQGGTYGATTPELQALYNARAKQEAELAASAQLAGQRDVTFGAGLLTKGAATMGDYYTGQTGAYAPYTTAMTQVKELETLGQKPFTMSTDLAQLTSAAGARVGEIGLRGAGQSVALATGAAATNNPYASVLSGLDANPAFREYLKQYLTSPSGSVTSGITPSSVTAAESGLPKDYSFLYS
jgi:hypothetical protein